MDSSPTPTDDGSIPLIHISGGMYNAEYFLNLDGSIKRYEWPVNEDRSRYTYVTIDVDHMINDLGWYNHNGYDVNPMLRERLEELLPEVDTQAKKRYK